ncbi:DUF3299 domain-containing protein [Radicibacter daui]|uniref:DUF3299 domain-containing protein n=1 Tax=Radicibacter daui TaxID=3064829 RepID=UPI004046ECE0
MSSRVRMSAAVMMLAAAIAVAPALPASALTYQENSDGTTRTLNDYIKDYVDVPKGATDWKVFGQTQEIDVKGVDKDGYDYEYTKPEFTPAVEALDGKQVTVKGFMFPLGETEGQKLFLFGPFPLSCPYHYHVGPSLVLEVHVDKKPINFSYDPITITGKLQLVKEDPEMNTFFRLMDAKVVKG